MANRQDAKTPRSATIVAAAFLASWRLGGSFSRWLCTETVWAALFIVAILAATGCRPAAISKVSAPRTVEEEMRFRLNPALQPLSAPVSQHSTGKPSNPLTIVPIPVRSWLPPAEGGGAAIPFPTQSQIAFFAPASTVAEIPPLAFVSSFPAAVQSAVKPAIAVSGPDPTRFTVRFTGEEVTAAKGAERHRLQGIDPTADLSSTVALATSPVLRETPLPFLRLNIPDPFEQIAAAELANPPPDHDLPAVPTERPANPFSSELPAAK